MSAQNTNINSNKKNNHKLLITTFIAVDVILIGLITLAFGGFAPGETRNQSFAAYETSSTVMTTQTSQSNSQIGVTVNNLITVNSSPTIFGTAPASSTVTISTSQENQTVMSDSNGIWKFTATAIYPVGIYDVRVEARDLSETIIGVDSTMDELEIISNSPTESSSSVSNTSTSETSLSESNSPNISSVQTMVTQSSYNSMVTANSTASSALTLTAVPVLGTNNSPILSISTSNVTSSKTSELAGLATPSRTIASISSPKVTSTTTSSPKTNNTTSTSLKTETETGAMTNTARTGGVDYLKIVSLLIFVAFNILIIKLKDKKVQMINLK